MLTHSNSAQVIPVVQLPVGSTALPRAGLTPSLPNRICGKQTAPALALGMGSPQGGIENRPNLLGSLPSPETLLWAPSPGVGKHLVTGGSGSQDRDKGPAAFCHSSFPASPQSSCLGSQHEPPNLSWTFLLGLPRGCSMGARELHPLAQLIKSQHAAVTSSQAVISTLSLLTA